MLNDTVRGGCDSPRGPHTYTHLLDFLSGFSVSSWPHRSCSDRPVSMTGLSVQPPIPRSLAIFGGIWSSQRAIWLQAVVYKMMKRSLGERREELAQNRCFPWDFWTMKASAAEGEATAIPPPPPPTHRPVCMLSLQLSRRPLFTQARLPPTSNLGFKWDVFPSKTPLKPSSWIRTPPLCCIGPCAYPYQSLSFFIWKLFTHP